jgi:hypothetical protein
MTPVAPSRLQTSLVRLEAALAVRVQHRARAGVRGTCQSAAVVAVALAVALALGIGLPLGHRSRSSPS